MWLFFWTQYSTSKFATFISMMGAMMRYAGVTCLFSGLIPAGLICIAIGIAIHFGAGAIAKSKVKKATGTMKKEKSSSPATTPNSTEKQVPKSTVQSNPTPIASAKSAETSTGQKRCTKCGAMVASNNMFCTECGNKFIKEKKCLRCGKVLTEEEKFCGQCGYQVK